MTQEQFNELKKELEGIYPVLDFYEELKSHAKKELQADNVPDNLLNTTMDTIDYTFMEYINSRLGIIVEDLKVIGGLNYDTRR